MNHLSKHRHYSQPRASYDRVLVLVILALAVVGPLMVASSSLAISERIYHQPFHYLFRQGLFTLIGLLAAVFIIRVRLKFWLDMAPLLLMISIFLLVLVMIPGIGRVTNGSARWIGCGPVGIQVSEFVKLAVVLYMGAYLARRHAVWQTDLKEFIRPLVTLGIIAGLLLLEPDFGATVVIVGTVLCMMYLAGVRLWIFVVLLVSAASLLGMLAIFSPYRLARLTTFLNPWANQYASGYQLTQSLIAFGRGGIWGVGLGGSVQKLFYLPEAHTDFLFAVLAEELGLMGELSIIFLYAVLVWRALAIGRRAQQEGLNASGLVAYGFAFWLGIQAVVNMGVNAGLLPTKGLTLPLLSYGGSSIIVVYIVLAILLRIDYEARTAVPGAKRYGIRNL